MQQGRPNLGDTPLYNYDQVDEDFLVLLLMADYFVADPIGTGRIDALFNQSVKL